MCVSLQSVCHRSECVKQGGEQVKVCVSVFDAFVEVVVECVKVCVTADDGWAGRTEQGTMNEVTDRDG